MTLQTLQAAVAEKVQDRIVPAVLERLGHSHKREWRECPCTWCATKREATRVIANVEVRGTRASVGYSAGTGWLSGRGEKEIIRESLRHRYRARLREEEVR